MVKVDFNANDTQPGLLPLHQHAPARFQRARDVAGLAGARSTRSRARQTFGGPLWNVLGNWTTTLSNRAFNEARVSYGVNKPWILSNLAGETGGSGLLEAAGYNLTTGNPTGKFASISYPGATFGATSFTGLEGEGSLFIVDNFSVIAGKSPVQARCAGHAHQDVHGRRGVTQGSLDLHPGSRLRRQQPIELSRPLSAATSEPATPTRSRGTRPSMCRTRGRPPAT